MADTSNITGMIAKGTENTLSRDTISAPEVSAEIAVALQATTSYITELERKADIAGDAPEEHSYFEDATQLKVALGDMKAAIDSGNMIQAASINGVIGNILDRARDDDSEEKEKKLIKTIKTAAIVASSYIAARAFEAAIEIPFSFMDIEEARAFALEFINGSDGLQERHSDMVSDHLEESGLDEVLSEAEIEYLETANVGTLNFTIEEHLETLNENATPEQRVLLDSIALRAEQLRNVETNMHAGIINGDAHQEALDATFANNPELIEALGGPDAAMAIIQSSYDAGDSGAGATLVTRLEMQNEFLSEAQSNLENATDPLERAKLETEVAAWNGRIEATENEVALTDALANEKLSITVRNTQELTELRATQGILTIDPENITVEQLQAIDANLASEQKQRAEQAVENDVLIARDSGITISEAETENSQATGSIEDQVAAIDTNAFDVSGLEPLEEKDAHTNLKAMGVSDGDAQTLPENQKAAEQLAKAAGVAGGEQANTASLPDIDASVLANLREQQELAEPSRSV